MDTWDLFLGYSSSIKRMPLPEEFDLIVLPPSFGDTSFGDTSFGVSGTGVSGGVSGTEFREEFRAVKD